MERYFIDGAKEIKESSEILNWYRNLYYKESMETERGIMARAINDILPEYVMQKKKIEKLEEILRNRD